MNSRCFKIGALFNLFFLASKERGASQHLRTISGVEMESDPSIKDILCQEEAQ